MTYELTVEHCIAIYEQEVRAGLLLRREQLEAAVAAPFACFGGVEAHPTLNDKAARLTYGIAQAQAFEDGNKRLAWLCAVIFLELNGSTIDVDQEEAARVVRALGEKRADDTPLLGLEGLGHWFNECLTYCPTL